MWAETRKAMVMRLPKPFRTDISPQPFLGAYYIVTGFDVCLAELCCFFSLIFVILLFIPFGMGMFTLCHCMWEVFKFHFDFSQVLTVMSLLCMSGKILNLTFRQFWNS